MKNLTINPDNTYKFNGTATRSELAEEYGMSDKRFRKELRNHNIFLPPGLLTRREVKQILDVLGSPTVYGTFEP